MMEIYVQFSDSTQKTVVSYFSGQQDPSVHPNLGQIDSSDARWATYCAAQSATVQALLPMP